MQQDRNLDLGGCLQFSLHQIRAATRNWDESYKLGEGGSAVVYKGKLRIAGRDVTVAVKRLRMIRGCHNDLEKEISMVSKFKHRNLVSLIGFCHDDSGESIIVYEYVDGGTLEDKLHNNTDVPLSFLQRLKILICIARALDYLHTGSFITVIHRDVKSSNILLVPNGDTAKLSDFGIAKIEDPGVQTRTIGTDGYADPAYVNTGQLTSKSDVFSFGVLLAEAFSGELAWDPTRLRDKDLATRARQWFKQGKAAKIIDPKLRSQISGTSLSELAKLILACLNDNPDKRPTMSMVLAQLELAFQNQNKGNGCAENIYPSIKNWIKKEKKRLFQGKVRSVSPVPATNNTVDAQIDIGCAPDLRILPVQYNELHEVTDSFAAETSICGGMNAKLYKCSSKSGQALFIRSLSFAVSDEEEHDGLRHAVSNKVEQDRHTRAASDKEPHDRLPHAVSDEEFLAQVSMVSELDHENVLKLLSYCKDTSLRAFVFEYTPKGSLYNILHGQGGSLSWPQRVKIAVGVAKGLAYLHEGHSNLVIHCELSSRNILLSDDNVPKIADFNLPIEVAKDPVFLLFTFEDYYEGYVKDVQAPHDVYCFGMVLLELLTGRRDGDPKFPLNEQYLVKWAIPKFCGDKLMQCMDPKLGPSCYVWQAAEMARIAQCCVQDVPTDRPSARVVAEKLSSLLSDVSGASSNTLEHS